MSKVLVRHTATVTVIPAADSLAPAAFRSWSLTGTAEPLLLAVAGS